MIIKKIFSVTISAVILLTFSACSGEGASETSDSGTTAPISSQASETYKNAAITADTENSEDTAASASKIPEGAPELVLLDGNKVTEDEIVKCTADLSGGVYHDELNWALYEVNTVFAYPCGTVNADKQIGSSPSVSKLSAGSKWGDFTVTKAEAAYQVPSAVPSNVLCQYLWLKGEISFECKAYYSKAAFENDESIVIELPEEISKKLPSLSPYADHYEDDEVDDCLYFMTYPGDGEFGRAIAEKLETEDEVEVTVSADEIKLQYTYFGLQTDGGTWGSLENVINFEIK